MRRTRQQLAHKGEQPGANRPPASWGRYPQAASNHGPAGPEQEAQSQRGTIGEHQCPWWPCSSRGRAGYPHLPADTSDRSPAPNPVRHGSSPRTWRKGHVGSPASKKRWARATRVAELAVLGSPPLAVWRSALTEQSPY